MRSPYRFVLAAWIVALALPFATATAEDAVYAVRDIARRAGPLLEQIAVQVRELQDRATMGNAADVSGQKVLMGGQFTVVDLQRSSQRLADLASEASSRLSKCDKDIRRMGRDFHSQARRINSTANRLSSSRERQAAGMTLSQIEFAVQRAYSFVPSLAAITTCNTESDATDEEAPAGKEEEQSKEEEEKQPEGS